MNISSKNEFSSKDITIIIPTKDRPDKIKKTLDAIANQTVKCAGVVVVASGKNINDVVMNYDKKLTIEYYHCDTPGQIKQRNLGIDKLRDRTKLVGFLDDDIILEPKAIETLLEFWNQKPVETAGIGLSIINKSPINTRSRIKDLLNRLKRLIYPPGRVLKSGFVTSFNDIPTSIRTSWLNGGSSFWRTRILSEFRQKEINCTWAVNEDVIFSYPVGKKYPLYVCQKAKAIHDHDITESGNRTQYYTRGRSWALWHLYFVQLHRELSQFACVSMMISRYIFGILVIGLYSKNKSYMSFYFGLISGTFEGIRTLREKGEIVSLLEQNQI